MNPDPESDIGALECASASIFWLAVIAVWFVLVAIGSCVMGMVRRR